MVDHGDIAQAAINGFDLGAVVALGFSRQVFLYALQPALGGVQPVGRDYAGRQRHHIGVLGRPRAQTPLPLRLCQLFVTRHLAGSHSFSRGHDQSGPGGQAKPVAIGITEVGRDVRVQRCRFHRLGQPGADGIGQTTNVNRENEIGR